ncbi:MAG: hypothetical protein Q9220_001779 [cf. Caloplaca sp. 1 TL-2023]
MVWWAVSARKWFKGPKVNIEHRMLGENKVLEGQAGQEESGEESSSGAGSVKDKKEMEDDKMGKLA